MIIRRQEKDVKKENGEKMISAIVRRMLYTVEGEAVLFHVRIWTLSKFSFECMTLQIPVFLIVSFSFDDRQFLPLFGGR